MSSAPSLERASVSSSRKRSRRPRVVRSAVIALVVYCLGLVPFYFLTPVSSSLAALFATPTAVRVAAQRETTPTQSPAQVKSKIGADVVSIAVPTAEATAVAAPVPAEAPADPRYAFLLLGYGGGGHDGAFLTDSIMAVVVDPSQKTLTFLSIPRDAWVPLLFDGRTAVYNKVNTAYAFALDDGLFPDRLTRYSGSKGAGVFVADTVSRLLGIPIRYYLGLDFSGFRHMIDAVGGIEVDVPESFAARYPVNDDPSIDASWTTVRFSRGPQHMAGERAIEFARAREAIDNVDEGTDFARSRRQRLIMEAFKTRLFEPQGLLHLPQLIGIAAQHVTSNYSVPDVAKLSQLALDWHDVRIYQTALTTQNFLEEATGPDGTYVLAPSASSHSWANVRAFARHLWQDPATGVAFAQTSLIVENDTGVAGAATRVTSVLLELGYNVAAPIAGSPRDRSRLIDTTGRNVGPVLAASLTKDLGIETIDVLEQDADTSGDVVLQLGSRDLKAASLVVSVDDLAPSSVVGIENFGAWVPDAAQAIEETPIAVTPVNSRRRTPVPTRLSTPLSRTPTSVEGSPTGASSRATPTPFESPVRGSPTARPSATPAPSASRTPTPRPL